MRQATVTCMQPYLNRKPVTICTCYKIYQTIEILNPICFKNTKSQRKGKVWPKHYI